MDNRNITLDVIIPAYRPGEKFRRLLSMLEKQTHPVNRLIIINTEEALLGQVNADRLEELSSSASSALYGRIELYHIDKSEFDHAFTRDRGVSYSSAEAFVCMTDDAVPEDEYLLERLCAALYQSEDIAMAYARQLPDETTDYAEAYTREFNYPGVSMVKSGADLSRLGIKTYFASNVCCMYKRELYDRLGGFEGPAIFNEDMVFAAGAIKAGYSIAYCAEARVIHAHSYTAMQQLRRNFDLGVSQAMHRDIFDEVPAEGEGMKLVLRTTEYLVKTGRPLLVPKLFIHSAAKLIGYRSGKCYDRLPGWLTERLAMNKSFVRLRLMKEGRNSKK